MTLRRRRRRPTLKKADELPRVDTFCRNQVFHDVNHGRNERVGCRKFRVPTRQSDTGTSGAQIRGPEVRLVSACSPMDRSPPSTVKPDVVLQPRWGAKVGYSVLLMLVAVGAMWELAVDGDVQLTVWLGLAVGTGIFVKVWRDQVVIVGPVLYRQGALRWCVPVRAEDVKEVTLYYDPGRIDFFRRELRFLTYDGRAQSFSIRWWRWSPLVAWLVKYCTRTENGQTVWSFKTDEKTRSRLEPYAEAHLAQSP